MTRRSAHAWRISIEGILNFLFGEQHFDSSQRLFQTQGCQSSEYNDFLFISVDDPCHYFFHCAMQSGSIVIAKFMLNC